MEKRIEKVLEKLLEDYQTDLTINKIKNFDLPDNEQLIEVLESLKKIIFPGYFRNHSVKIYTVRNHASMLLEDVIYKLVKQISIVLHYLPEYEDAEEEIIIKKAEDLTFAFLEKIPKIREYIETDVQATFDGDPACFNKT